MALINTWERLHTIIDFMLKNEDDLRHRLTLAAEMLDQLLTTIDDETPGHLIERLIHLHNQFTTQSSYADSVMLMDEEQIDQAFTEYLALYHDVSIAFEKSKG